ncbi:MAG: YbaB/EbfC family nucleoid-associated protein [Candidatus Omnitrophota bacterium]
MLDKIKALMDMKGKMHEIKRELENTFFDIESPDGVVKLTMNGSQEIKEISIQGDHKGIEKNLLEKSFKDAYNRAIKRSHEMAAEKMKESTGFNVSGLL